jgi:hypothetical protein
MHPDHPLGGAALATGLNREAMLNMPLAEFIAVFCGNVRPWTTCKKLSVIGRLHAEAREKGRRIGSRSGYWTVGQYLELPTETITRLPAVQEAITDFRGAGRLTVAALNARLGDLGLRYDPDGYQGLKKSARAALRTAVISGKPGHLCCRIEFERLLTDGGARALRKAFTVRPSAQTFAEICDWLSNSGGAFTEQRLVQQVEAARKSLQMAERSLDDFRRTYRGGRPLDRTFEETTNHR